ncbi:(2Fe-2S)-binding protein [Aphanothece hegewaldii CCALA 016]|uniref:(2Fe-2S)-binding protein n=1 Tax=Aphanothece hegewaldii CCALA 016 TaxID=2107694 RepID=A0A2T1LR68_9CHRO|nr:(2Fe-2S)-binding protein [Aphanothece hegewaldii CCALA 016]
MADFVEAIGLDRIPPGKGTTVTIANKSIALFNVDGQIYAIDDACPHAGSSLGWGKLDGKIVTCRTHGLKVNVTTGCMMTSPDLGVTSYPVQVINEIVRVEIP